MALQRINWTQIDTENVPSGFTVNLGKMDPLDPGVSSPERIDGVHTNDLSILGVDFFDYLNDIGYTGHTPNTITVEDNAGLEVVHQFTGTTLSTTYNTTLDVSLSTPEKVGGIEAGTTVAQLSGKTFVQFVDELLFPVVLPTYTIPTITLGGVASQIYEVGNTFSPNITLSGTKNDAGAYSQLRILRNGSPILTDNVLSATLTSNIPDQFGFPDPNNPNYIYGLTSSPYVESYVIPAGSPSSSTTYQGDGNYGAGLRKLDNKGNTDGRAYVVRNVNAPQSGSNNFTTGTYTITGIFPYFYGTSLTLPTTATIAAAIAGGTATKVLSQASGTLAIPYNNPSTWLYIWFAYPSDYTTKTKWWVNALDNGDIDGSFITTVATQGVNSPDGYWTGKSFKMHWSVYQTQQNTIEFRNS